MIERCKNYIVTYLATLSEGNSTMILKMAPGIDKNVPPDMDILSEIGIKRREKTHRIIDFPSEESRKQRPNLFLRMILPVQLERNTSSLIALFVHKLHDLLRIQQFPFPNDAQKLFQCNHLFLF